MYLLSIRDLLISSTSLWVAGIFGVLPGHNIYHSYFHSPFVIILILCIEFPVSLMFAILMLFENIIVMSALDPLVITMLRVALQ